MHGQVKVYQKKIVARRRRRAILLSAYSVIGISLMLSGLSYISKLDSMSLDSIAVEGNERISSQKLEAIANESLSGSYLYLFSKRNTFLYPDQGIEDAILALPAVERVDVSRRGLSTLVINVDERDDAAKWCSGELEDSSSCYLIDEDGLVFSSAQGDSGAFIFRGRIEGDPIGKEYLSSADFRKIRFFINEVDGLSIDPRELSISETGYMTLLLGAGGKLYINMSDDLSIVLENIAAITSDKSVAPDFALFLRNLDYMKLDSGNKVVYKLK